MTIAEQIYALVKSFPQEQAQEVLDFAEFLRSKNQPSNSPETPTIQANWKELVNSLNGAWADDFPSLEEIRAQPGQDIPLELAAAGFADHFAGEA